MWSLDCEEIALHPSSEALSPSGWLLECGLFAAEFVLRTKSKDTDLLYIIINLQ